MDELTMVREALPAALPPGGQVTARARQRLDARMAAPGGQPRRSRRLRWAAPLTGVAAAGLAGALAVAALLPGGARHGRPGHGPGGLITSERLPGGVLTGRPAQPFLVALATRVGSATPAAGRYWCVGSVSAQLDAIGPGGQELTPPGQGETPSPVSDYRYSIFARQSAEDCFEYTRTTSRNVGGYLQDLGARPATAADAAAWRRDGSPAWHAWYQARYLIPARPGARQLTGGKPGQPPWGSPAALPADPAKLRRVLLAGAVPAAGPQAQPGAPRAQLAATLFMQARTLLLDGLSPAVRAADYQVLASVPGVHMKAGVTDPSGRAGTALWLGPATDPGEVSIVDPRTGLLLADEFFSTAPHGVYAPGTLQQYVLWQTPGWAGHLPGPGK